MIWIHLAIMLASGLGTGANEDYARKPQIPYSQNGVTVTVYKGDKSSKPATPSGRKEKANSSKTEIESSQFKPYFSVEVGKSDAVHPANIDPNFTDANWSSMNPNVPGAGGGVNAAVADSSGNLYIGGDFAVAGNVLASNVARWNGTNWSALGSGLDGPVFALAMSGRDLYVGGAFRTASGIPAYNIAKWDGNSWRALSPGVDGDVRALAIVGSDLYVGGRFRYTVSAPPGNLKYLGGIAKWNGDSWDPLADGGVEGSIEVSFPGVYALAVSGGDLYVGGDFTRVGGIAAGGVAKWNGSAWSALDLGVSDSVPKVYSLAISEGELYAGGRFARAGEIAATNIAKWNGTTWSALGLGSESVIYALAVLNGSIHAAGPLASPEMNAANQIAEWNGTNWSPLGSAFSSSTFPLIRTLAVSGSEVYAGGIFTTTDDERPASGIAKWTGSSWTSLGASAAVNGPVLALAVSGTEVFAGGFFTAGRDISSTDIAKWNGTNWSALGSGMSGTSFPTIVNALAVYGGDLYAGGSFASAGGMSACNIAKWNGTNWSAVGSAIDGSSFLTVSALAASANSLYAGGSGSFSAEGGLIANSIAKWDGISWSALGSGVNGYVNALAVSGNDLYVGGNFTSAGGKLVDNIAKWDGNSWTPLGGVSPSGVYFPGVNGPVFALAVSGSDLYVGGRFERAGGKFASHVAKWNGSAWIDFALDIGVNCPVYALAVSGSSLYAGGEFTTAGRVAVSKISKWNGTAWSALGTGISGSGTGRTVHAIAVSETDLYAGGTFTTAGGKVSAYAAHAYLQTLPELSMHRSGSNVKIAWPSADEANFILERTSRIAASNWITNDATVTNDGTNKSVTVSATNSVQIFRLRKP